ncbi:MAG: hypothetical protein IJL15_04665 [Clostridia bacterium]|nr:hypothetical protein [Clostridia bacterium]
MKRASAQAGAHKTGLFSTASLFAHCLERASVSLRQFTPDRLQVDSFLNQAAPLGLPDFDFALFSNPAPRRFREIGRYAFIDALPTELSLIQASFIPCLPRLRIPPLTLTRKRLSRQQKDRCEFGGSRRSFCYTQIQKRRGILNLHLHFNGSL